VSLAAFLNHLCDGELLEIVTAVVGIFLNHLCDGELFNPVREKAHYFLNHLCDGERKAALDAFNGLLSKPSMRWRTMPG